MAENLFAEGLQLMAVGMLVVFSFLVIMVFAVNISAVILKKLERFFPEEQTAQAVVAADKSIIAAVIAVARSQAKK